MEKQEMTDKQFGNFKRYIEFEADRSMKAFIKDEIEAKPDDAERTEFLNGIRKSDFFRELFTRGFIEGISFNERNKDTKVLV